MRLARLLRYFATVGRTTDSLYHSRKPLVEVFSLENRNGMGLNENQERAVAVTLRLLEERLADIERVIAEDEEGALYRRVARFSPEQREKMNNLIAAMRGQIRRAAARFHLPQQEQDAAREIVGKLMLSWESLEDSRPRKLGAYGDVDPALKETLDPILQELIRLLFRLDAVARDGDRS